MARLRRTHSLRQVRTVVNRAVAGSFARSLPVHDRTSDSSECFWCGQPAGTRDHLWPLTKNGRWTEYPEVLVSSCSKCNFGRRGTLDLDESIARNARITDPERVHREIQQLLADVPLPEGMSPAAREELNQIYVEYEATWARLYGLDERIANWCGRWRADG